MRVFIVLSALFAGSIQAQAQEIEPNLVYSNIAKMNGCMTLDGNSLPKPNNSPTCKVISNVPGDTESVLVMETSVNVGTIAAPKERPTRIEMRVTKEKGKLVKIERRYSDPASPEKFDAEIFEFDGEGNAKDTRASQNGQTFAVLNPERCKPLQKYAAAFSAQKINECFKIATDASGAIKEITKEMAKEQLRLGNWNPNFSLPSLQEFKPVDADRLGDVFMALQICKNFEPLQKAAPKTPGGTTTAAPPKNNSVMPIGRQGPASKTAN